MPVTKARDHSADLGKFLEDYSYQDELTAALDCRKEDFSQRDINEIVLWKLNRYVAIPQDVLNSLNAAKEWEPSEHRKAASLLETLIDTHGCDLPMASTFLRYRNPNVFQIIDRHAYRAVYGTKYPLYTASAVSRKVDVYFKYLDAVRSLCDEKGIEFRHADRILYMFDKKNNGTLNEQKSKTVTA